jgi:hypothetical protein
VWQRRFGADPRVIGKAVHLDGASYTVVGIMPGRFRVGHYDIRLWVPLTLPPERLTPAARADRRLGVLAQLKPSVSVDAAKAEMATLGRRAEDAHPLTG